RRQLAATVFADLTEGAWAVFALIDVNGLEPVDVSLGFVGQIIIGVVHIDVLRIAAAGGELEGERHGGLGRAGVVGVVGVERLAGNDAPAVLDLVVGNVVHAGMTRHVALLLVVQLNLAEEPRSGLELVGPKVLLAHHQHMMLGECAAQHRAVIGVDWMREVEAGDLDAGVRRQRRDVERHCTTLHARIVAWTLEPGGARVKQRRSHAVLTRTRAAARGRSATPARSRTDAAPDMRRSRPRRFAEVLPSRYR